MTAVLPHGQVHYKGYLRQRTMGRGDITEICSVSLDAIGHGLEVEGKNVLQASWP